MKFRFKLLISGLLSIIMILSPVVMFANESIKETDFQAENKAVNVGVRGFSWRQYWNVLILMEDDTLWRLNWVDNYDCTKGYYTSKIADGIKSMSTKHKHVLMLKTDNTLWAYGDNEYGQIGNGTRGGRFDEPVKIMEDVMSISAGHNYSMAIKNDGSLWGWGNNSNGELGDGTMKEKYSPVKITNNIISISTGSDSTIGLSIDGNLWGWGWGAYSRIATPMLLMDSVKSISSGYANEMFINNDNSLWQWKSSNSIKIMDDVDSLSLLEWFDKYYTVLKLDGTVWTWGYNKNGELGDGTNFDKEDPVKILDDVKSVCEYASAAIKNDGTLWIWGNGILSPMKINIEAVSVGGVEIEWYGSNTIEIEKAIALRAKISPDNAANKKVLWNSDKPSVASVSDDGTVTGISEGIANITVKTEDGGFEAMRTITVKSSNESKYTVRIAAAKGGEIIEGETGLYAPNTIINLSAKANDSNYRFVNWTSNYSGQFSNTNSSSTTFKVPTYDTVVVANFTSTSDTPTLLPTQINTKIILSEGSKPGTTKIAFKKGNDYIPIDKLEYAVTDNLSRASWQKCSPTIKDVPTNASMSVYLRLADSQSTPTSGVPITIGDIKSEKTSAITVISNFIPGTLGMTELTFKNADGMEYKIASKIDKKTLYLGWTSCTDQPIVVAANSNDKVIVRKKATLLYPASTPIITLKKLNFWKG